MLQRTEALRFHYRGLKLYSVASRVLGGGFKGQRHCGPVSDSSFKEQCLSEDPCNSTIKQCYCVESEVVLKTRIRADGGVSVMTFNLRFISTSLHQSADR